MDRDPLGQQLFGDNTYVTYKDRPVRVRAGSIARGSFSFIMPYLPRGDYSVAPAVAEGSQEKHTQHHWIDDAVFFKVATSPIPRGIIGIPMSDISLSVQE